MARRTARGSEEIAVEEEGRVGRGWSNKITLGFFMTKASHFIPFALFAFPKYECLGKRGKYVVIFKV